MEEFRFRTDILYGAQIKLPTNMLLEALPFSSSVIEYPTFPSQCPWEKMKYMLIRAANVRNAKLLQELLWVTIQITCYDYYPRNME